MKTRNTLVLLMALAAGSLFYACDKEDEPGNDCYTCDSCTGQYAHLLNGREYCVDGFDNRSDWEANKTAQQTDSGCTCQ